MQDQAKKNKTRLAVALLAISAGLFLVLVASSQNESHKSITHQEIEKEASPPKVYTVGNINGVPVSIPSHVMPTLRQYDDTPGPFSREWQDYKRPTTRTHKDNLMSFGFEFKYPANELYGVDGFNLKRYYDEQRASPNPWIYATVTAGKATPKVSLEKSFRRYINADRGYAEEDPWGRRGNYYHRTNQIVYGLEVYSVNQELLGEVAMLGETDLFVHRNNNAEVMGFIECSTNEVPNPPCSHYFRWTGFNGAKGILNYSRHHLEHWQEIQQLAEQYLRSWIVEPEKNSVVLK